MIIIMIKYFTNLLGKLQMTNHPQHPHTLGQGQQSRSVATPLVFPHLYGLCYILHLSAQGSALQSYHCIHRLNQTYMR